MPAELDDYRWLVGADAEPWLRKVAETESLGKDAVRMAATLRKELSVDRAALVVEQVELRRKAKVKFPAAERMFFTRRSLEQATDAAIAAAKAARFPAGAVADLCCGIGGDLMALAQRGPATGIDCDPLVAILATANLAMHNSAQGGVLVRNVEDYSLAAVVAWHIDPDRRASGTRSTSLDHATPSLAVLRQLLKVCPQAAIKLAPATDVPDDWTRDGERMWIGHRRECQQQVVWHGGLAKHAGQHSALVLDDDPNSASPLVGQPGIAIPAAVQVGRYLFEPQAAVLAADLTGQLAAQHALSAAIPGVAYLTGDQPLATPYLAAFAVLEVLPLDMKKLKAAVRARGFGTLEIKQRGTGLSPEAVRKQLAAQGDRPGVVLLARNGLRSLAILAERPNP